ncbi:MAG: hypothetical protein VX185_09745 [Pseudomonadota bacterium]|nr:hypothetical protein [Pseudomonadota bacterium]
MPQQVQASSNTFASGYSPANNTTAQQSKSSTQVFTPTTEQPQTRATQHYTHSMSSPMHVAQQSILTAIHERNASYAGFTGTVIGSTTATLGAIAAGAPPHVAYAAGVSGGGAGYLLGDAAYRKASDIPENK